jgi:hypothetical protein
VPGPTTLLRRGRTFELWRTSHETDASGKASRGALLVRPVEPGSQRARERLALAVAAHRAIDAPHVARCSFAQLEGRDPHALFDFDPMADGEEVVARLSARGKLPYEAAIGFIQAYATALAAAHATTHPTTGSPCCLGAVGWGSFVFDRSGDFVLLGFGAPLSLEVVPPSPGAFVAPEVGAGAAPSPGADVLAFALLQRSSLGLVAIPDRLASALFSLPAPSDLRLVAWLADINRRLFVAGPEARPTVEEVLEVFGRAWKRLDATPDLDAYRRLTAAALGDPRATTLRASDDGAWFEVRGSERRSLSRRAAPRRIFAALLASARTDPERGVPVATLFQAGWPGERIRADSSAGRVYVALSTLRRFGLADVIERFEDGYRIRPSVRIV